MTFGSQNEQDEINAWRYILGMINDDFPDVDQLIDELWLMKHITDEQRDYALKLAQAKSK